MEPLRSPRTKRDEHRRRRSQSTDSEEERRRRRRRRERELDDSKAIRDDRTGDRSSGTGEVRERHSAKDEKRRRSRSPRYESSRRRHDDHESKYRSRDRSPGHRSRGLVDAGSSKEGSEAQLTRKSKGPLPSQEMSFKSTTDPSMALVQGGDKEIEKQKPNFGNTGLLAAASNQVQQADGTSIILKYHEPAEARKPPTKDQWKLFVFKGADIVETVELHMRSCWLVGRELAVVDMPAEHPSISKQHAVIQFRYIEKKNEYGDKLGRVRPYLIDLDSANGTTLNKEAVPGSRYLELRDKDMIQFGHSTREYVLMLPPKD
ncbi:hypothetical protein BP6252_02527 [Coleophoma cylindrospora]|uniref:FHA domain-containing protein n=1 Tax=Coleophoma cylindrospora TaxID=1849047 RepID=A0A3D8SF18_9HELO|nr:hypothetical protein BP6252_02527 [Coleophoma cylindrospora]